MCTVKMYKATNSKHCTHKWMIIDTPCGYGMGFSNCPTIKRGTKRTLLTGCYKAWAGDCPWHGLKGNYDFNLVRVVEKVKPAMPSLKEFISAFFS